MQSIKTCISRPLFWVFILALLTRLPAVWQGLPAVFNSTEYFTAKTALSMAARISVDPQTYIYPAGWYFVEIIVFGALFLFGLVFGWVANSAQFAVQFLIDPTLFYVSARFVSVAISLLAIGIIYRIVKKRHETTMASIVAMTVAADHYLQNYAATATADSLLFLFSTLSVFFLMEAGEGARKRALIFAGFFAGMAIGTKYNAGFLAPAVLLAVWLTVLPVRQRLLLLAKTLAAILTGFLVFNPGWVAAPGQWWEGYLLVRDQMHNAVSMERGVNYLWEISQLLRHASLPVLAGLGFSIWLLIFERRKKDWPLHLIWALTFVYVGSWQKKGIDYLLPIFPVWFVFLSDALSRLKRSRMNRVVIALLMIPSILYALYFAFLSLQPDTRQLASEWIIRNVPADETICYDNYHYDLTVFDVRRYTEYGAGAKSLSPEIKARLTGYMNHPRQRAMVSAWKDSVVSKSGSYLDQNSGRRHKTVSELNAEGVYLVINNATSTDMYISADEASYAPGISKQIRSVRRFYDQLKKGSKQVLTFKPDWNTPGPRIEIYNMQ